MTDRGPFPRPWHYETPSENAPTFGQDVAWVYDANDINVCFITGNTMADEDEPGDCSGPNYTAVELAKFIVDMANKLPR